MISDSSTRDSLNIFSVTLRGIVGMVPVLVHLVLVQVLVPYGTDFCGTVLVPEILATIIRKMLK